MLSRILPPDEWPRLAGTELEAVIGSLDPSWTKVLVVEDHGAIVGCWALLNVWHLEGVWIAPAYRGRVSVARRLWVGMKRLMTSVGAQAAVTAAMSEDVSWMLRRATPLPGVFYTVRMGDTCRRQSSAA